ncbi:hypothetical protein MSAN_00620300 [Mycena sanguinolenta]|uniref:Uncharacterized protein n=1 Tax=Mycena sanguinolenta TaxID=230812 RepID=A0A8H6Z0G2_9AGAR|nr:hypothetical protein MSAN_00620300 [Mycena sanguinolenta]
MLLFLLAVRLLSEDGEAASLSHPLDARVTTDSCDDINRRTLFSIVWECLATIFACTWISVHPNVPPPSQNRLQLFRRKLKMMLIAIIAPEIMVGFAARQFFASRWLVKEFNFSSTQACFFCMGGFVSSTGHPIATKKQLRDPGLGSKFRAAIRNVNDEEIMDKSKGDALSKGVAFLQGLWFILHCLARVHQHLAVTQLEIATLAFAVVNVFIWLLWWNKPLDVQRPIVVGPHTLPESPDTQATTHPDQRSNLDGFLSAIAGISADDYNPLSSVSVPLFWSVDNEFGRRPTILLILGGAVFGAIHCTAWNAVFPTPPEMQVWRTSAVVIIVFPGLASLIPLTAMSDRLKSVFLTISIIMILASPIYIAARLTLIVLPLAGLRFLPASAFVDVNWSSYIPHI